MSLLQIRTYPDTVLRKKARPVDVIDGEFQQFVDNMIETMYAAPGIGLAAPQVGVSQKLIVVDISTRDTRYPLIVIVNPVITANEGVVESEEGCLSVPGYSACVKRAEKILVRGVDREGNPIEIMAEDLLARALQHEIDHLEGKLFVDRLNMLKRELFRKNYHRKLKEKK